MCQVKTSSRQRTLADAARPAAARSHAGRTTTPSRASNGSRFTTTSTDVVAALLREREQARRSRCRGRPRCRATAAPGSRAGSRSAARRAAAAARRARASSARTSRSRGTPRSLAQRHVLAVLVPGVDPVARRERAGEHEPRLERRPAALLQVAVEDVRRVDEEVRPVVRRPTRAGRPRTRSSSQRAFFQVKYV